MTVSSLINYKQPMTTINTPWFNLSIKVISYGALLFILFDNDCVHILCQKFNLAFTTARVDLNHFKMIYVTHIWPLDV
jgi:hypothetical protein